MSTSSLSESSLPFPYTLSRVIFTYTLYFSFKLVRRGLS